MADIALLAEQGISTALKLGATYADFRVVDTRQQTLKYVDGAVGKVEQSHDVGFSIRVIAGGGWGFFASPDLVSAEVIASAKKAVGIARASAVLRRIPVALSSEPAVSGEYRSPYEKDPFGISLSEKLSFMAEIDALIAGQSGISTREIFFDFRKQEKHFFSSEGARILQHIVHSGAGVTVVARGQGRQRAVRSFPSNEGIFQTKGYELLDEIDFAGQIPVICQQAAALLNAPVCPTKRCDIVIDGSHLGLVIHETIGHALELDRVFGSERNFSGTSYATPDAIGRLQLASPLVNVVADPTALPGLGSFGYDDEGVPARRTDLIRNGVLVGYLSSRETAQRLGCNSSGAMIADGWDNLPLIRMNNTNLLPGNYSLSDLISGIDDGIYMETSSSWSIDDKRENFQFGCQIGWLIEGGKLTTMIQNPTFSGQTISFWNSCDGVADASLWQIWGTPNCGKGQPGQNARTGQGASPARFRNVKVGR